jgi:L-seryl-tRNA(Ser) seleniumtransferase
MTDTRRALPSVNALLESEAVRPLLERAPRPVVVDAIRAAIDAARQSPESVPGSDAEWASAVSSRVQFNTRRSLRRVINATGVVLHTNLGRAPLARAAIDAIEHVASGFSNLEYDIDAGARGSRYVHCASLLRDLTGAEDALVVNNCAAALVLVLDTVANGREAILSRGELIEIGGSFRVPEIMEKSGARLVEVGTTNRTHLDDYRRAVGAETGVLLKVHRSNFAVSGFVAEATARDLAAFAAERGLPLVHDLGSGLMMRLDEFGLSGEPTARDALAAGASVVTMSGDKLLGGPQAGLILGKRDILDRVRKNPLTRSYRVDKLTLAALEATLALYREPARAVREIPALAQLTATTGALRVRAERLRERLGAQATEGRIAVTDSEASVGGGAFPAARIPSVALALAGRPSELERLLRNGDPAIVARVSADRLVLDLRTVFPAEDEELAAALQDVLRAVPA